MVPSRASMSGRPTGWSRIVATAPAELGIAATASAAVKAASPKRRPAPVVKRPRILIPDTSRVEPLAKRAGITRPGRVGNLTRAASLGGSACSRESGADDPRTTDTNPRRRARSRSRSRPRGLPGRDRRRMRSGSAGRALRTRPRSRSSAATAACAAPLPRARRRTAKRSCAGGLKRAPGKPDPWRHAYAADLSAIARPGSYRVVVGQLRSRPWRVDRRRRAPALLAILRFFAANRDGDEPSPIHGPAHLNDAIVHPDAPAHAGERIDITGGWMDAGDMLHFTQTTAFAAALLEAAARLDPADAAALEAEADVGIRWLVKAHPAPDLFIAQVGDERDHDLGFRDPADDDASAKPGIGTRFAYPEIGGDLGGKAAAALALAYRRTGDPALLAAAQEWYAAGKAAGRAAPAAAAAPATRPTPATSTSADLWKDSMAAGAAELYRATCAAGICVGAYLDDFRRFIAARPPGPDGDLGVVDSFASLRRRRRLRRLRRAAAARRARATVGCDAPAPQREDRRRAGARATPSACPATSAGGRRRPERRQRGARPRSPRRRRRAAPAAARSPPAPATTCSGATRSAQLRRRLRPRAARASAPLGLGVRRGAAARRRRRRPGSASGQVSGQGFQAARPAQQPLRRLRGPPRRLRHLRAGDRLRRRLGADARRADALTVSTNPFQ